MGIESSASLLSTQIVNIVHEKNPDAKMPDFEKADKIRGPDEVAGKDVGSSFMEAEISSDSYEGVKAPETYNENGYLNKAGETADVKNQKEYTIDLVV